MKTPKKILNDPRRATEEMMEGLVLGYDGRVAKVEGHGAFFLKPPDPNTLAGKVQLGTPPFWRQQLVWGIAAVAAVLAVVITIMNKIRD